MGVWEFITSTDVKNDDMTDKFEVGGVCVFFSLVCCVNDER